MKTSIIGAMRLAVVAGLFCAATILTAHTASASEESQISRGGRLYDKFWSENKTSRPTEANELFKGSGSKSNSWRCKNCHGWDLNGDKEAGVKGIRGAAGKDTAAIAATLRDANHPYTKDMLTDQDVQDLALFVSKGQYDAAKAVKGDAKRGEVYYAAVCGVCHGTDGKKVSTGMPIGDAATTPDLLFFKALHGQPGEAMPSLRVFDHQIAADIVAFSKSLPK